MRHSQKYGAVVVFGRILTCETHPTSLISIMPNKMRFDGKEM